MKRLIFLVIFTIAAYITVLTCMVSCANRGAGPDGGPYDETPPRIVGMTPPSQVAGGAMTKGKKKHPSTKFSLLFSELVTIENAAENVIVSPPQIEMPNIQAVGRRINVELLDSLKPNTTYTIDFSDAIKDNNEGNPLGHFTYIFSTGEVTDTMEMSGYVLNAEDLEPIAGILVGLHPCPEGIDVAANFDPLWMADTLFTTTPFDRVARTDASGYFSVKGVRDGRQYFAYALKDGDGDFAFSQRSEQIAFSPEVLKPSAFPDTRYDTLWIDSTRYDSIRVIPYTHYTPDNIMLLAFQEANQPRYMLKSDRTDFENFKIWFSAPSQHVPVIRGLNFDATNAFVEQRSIGNDTLVYWLRDTLLMQQDTLDFVYEYMVWDDSLQIHRLTEDTLQLTSRTPWKKRLEQRQKDEEKWQKQLERRHKRGDYTQEEPPTEFMKLTCSTSSSLAPNQNVLFTFDQPLDTIDLSGVHLELMQDSIGTPAPFLLDDVPNNILARQLMAEWRPEQKYRLTIDSTAIHTIYGLHNNKFTKEFTIDKLDKFGTLFITLTGLPELKPMSLGFEQVIAPAGVDTLASGEIVEIMDTTMVERLQDPAVIVQLLDRSGKVIYSVEAVKVSKTSVRGEFYYLKEGDYFVRCIVDANANGKWDPGVWSERRGPEDVFYMKESVNVRAGWDDNMDWDVAALPRHQQKPDALVKQKKNERGKVSAHERNIKRLEDRAKGPQNNSSGRGSMGVPGLKF
ncbi:MAG: Ig-like domain-containing protein [Bacteroidales bacterium]|nr:Ig-like domain-containing protein [Bacteroidales bacterium]